MTSVSQALKSLRPTSEFVCIGEDYNNVIWKDLVNEKPSLTEVEAEVSRLRQVWIDTEYQRLRKPKYPPMADYLDAVYWQSQGDDTKMTAYLAAVEAVKQRYPKENT